MIKILIIGGSGWLGGYLQACLNKKGHRAVITSRKKSGNHIVRFILAEPG